MDSILTTISSSPIVTSLSLVACILLLAGYYFFVIPLLHEVKELKTKNLELQTQLSASLTSNEQLTIQYKELSVKTQSSVLQVKSFISTSAKEHADSSKAMLKDLENSLDRLLKDHVKPEQLYEIRNAIASFVSEVNSQLYAVQNTMTDVRALCDSIKDRQSTLNGIIMATGGAGLLGNANIGVK